MYRNYNNFHQNERFGGFLTPFLLGGITGGLVAPLFYNNRPYYGGYYPQPYYYQQAYYPQYYYR